MNRKQFLLGLAVGVLSLGTSLSASADQLADIKSAGELRVAVPQDYPPFGFVGPDMKLKGYDINMAAYIAKELGVKVKLVPVTGANRVPFLQSGKADIVISTLGKTEARAKVIDFSIAYGPTFLGVFGPASVKVEKPSDLSGHTVGFTRGGVEDQMITPLAPKDAVLKRYEDNNTTSQAYLSGQVEMIATINLVAGALVDRAKADRKPEAKFLLRKSPCFVGLNKNEPALKDAVNKAITKAFNEGELNRWSEEFLKAPIPADLITQEPEKVTY
ncbi:transporter substrate-binding domain-containing protein [Sutterella sp.]|uniref:transporter substrate-binding domain-containing protein n=1 Tax=Sutterella sp. TaxID=1981025 RepID=UPI0026E01338|nr:transporter substrate-binding domain-containing protein [Sutterella sp.]MDO5531965.1 transporter substrate-binding domain-containing protein [Sutterella sp.]